MDDILSNLLELVLLYYKPNTLRGFLSLMFVSDYFQINFFCIILVFLVLNWPFMLVKMCTWCFKS